jgi:hypothetical protein
MTQEDSQTEAQKVVLALDALGLGYDLPVGQAVYAIDAFPDDDLLWRIEWIGGVGYNTSVPNEAQIDVCLAQLSKGEKNPLSARARSYSSREENGEDRCWSAALRLDRLPKARAAFLI